ncbi:hypothetical protein NDU88_006722 [Pleurodeles waltl]|uniref:Uncharacterized protein n=1 Tax=Pleurodeles waltl TaxID=8319 RepID=A0AAV7RS09_PLEWA|nr:hypothetical protein NDU88_006722 [Pleurodeles waltl]
MVAVGDWAIWIETALPELTTFATLESLAMCKAHDALVCWRAAKTTGGLPMFPSAAAERQDPPFRHVRGIPRECWLAAGKLSFFLMKGCYCLEWEEVSPDHEAEFATLLPQSTCFLA